MALFGIPFWKQDKVIYRVQVFPYTWFQNSWPPRGIIKTDSESLKTGSCRMKDGRWAYCRRTVLFTLNFLQEAKNNWTVEIFQSQSDPTGKIHWAFPSAPPYPECIEIMGIISLMWGSYRIAQMQQAGIERLRGGKQMVMCHFCVAASKLHLSIIILTMWALW
jgi:hypothetical protein